MLRFSQTLQTKNKSHKIGFQKFELNKLNTISDEARISYLKVIIVYYQGII